MDALSEIVVSIGEIRSGEVGAVDADEADMNLGIFDCNEENVVPFCIGMSFLAAPQLRCSMPLYTLGLDSFDQSTLVVSSSLSDMLPQQMDCIAEIRMGRDGDIIDMTSQRFFCIRAGINLYSGAENDVISANDSKKTFGGDAGSSAGTDKRIMFDGIGKGSMRRRGGHHVLISDKKIADAIQVKSIC